MKSIVAISGSLRARSFNTALLAHAAMLNLPGIRIEIASIKEIPLYDEDAPFPAAAAVLKERIAAADGLLIASPEYNHSMPGVLKNALDWLSLPRADLQRVFAGLPVALIGASKGPYGTVLGQAAWLQVWRALYLQPWFGERPLYVANAERAFDPRGCLVDQDAARRLERYVRAFAHFVLSFDRRAGAPADTPSSMEVST